MLRVLDSIPLAIPIGVLAGGLALWQCLGIVPDSFWWQWSAAKYACLALLWLSLPRPVVGRDR